MKLLRSSAVLAYFLLFSFHFSLAQTNWLTDEQARDVAAATIHSVYPEPCYSTYRDERLESFVLGVRKERLVGNKLNNSVYLYRVASDACDYVVEKDGKPVLMSQVTMDCCEYGIVAVDRATTKSYWFRDTQSTKAADTFKEFVRDEQLRPDSPNPTLFTGLYLELIWGEYNGKELTSLWQFRDLVEANFRSAYSPYEQDNIWEQKFAAWWRQFRSRMKHVQFETTYERMSDGTIVRGLSFGGFTLTTPRRDPPPQGTPTVLQWALLVKADGTVEKRPSKVVYSAR